MSGGHEPGGNTKNGMDNAGLKQAFTGSSFNAADAQRSILAMVSDRDGGNCQWTGLVAGVSTGGAIGIGHLKSIIREVWM